MKLKLSAGDEQTLHAIRSFIERDLHSRYTIQQLACTFMINDHKLKNGFKQLFGSTISDYRERKKIERATALLECDDLTVRQVCYKVGYKTPSTFFRAFKKMHKMSPKEWKEKNSPKSPFNSPDLQSQSK